MMKIVIVQTLAITTLLGCERRETPEYLSEVSGLDICPPARVKNLNSDDPGRFPGFDTIHIAEVVLPPACVPQLNRSFLEATGVPCDSQVRCAENTRDGGFISIEYRDSSVVITHST